MQVNQTRSEETETCTASKQGSCRIKAKHWDKKGRESEKYVGRNLNYYLYQAVLKKNLQTAVQMLNYSPKSRRCLIVKESSLFS